MRPTLIMLLAIAPILYQETRAMPFSGNFSTHLTRVSDNRPVLIVPGLRNSDQQHWQTLWQNHLPNASRIELDHWDKPDLAKWQNAIRKSLDAATEPVIVIAHSFGTLASASLAAEYADKIIALFLVAPADPDKFSIAAQLPQHILPTETKIIASSNDPWMTDSKAAYWALQWGADFLRLKNAGHINSDSSLGLWPEGVHELQQLLLKARRNLNNHRAA
ncbi:MAG TPA: alpha/beta hydrolase [Cellvibrio sp.]|nr:alpha/beta hydrolase [Cellvibrio sp.]